MAARAGHAMSRLSLNDIEPDETYERRLYGVNRGGKNWL
jgi:hypothetical protein